MESDEKVSVKTVQDIKAVLDEFAQPRKPHKVSAQIKARDSSGRQRVYAVEAQSNCDYNHLFIEGFEILQKRVEINDELADTLSVGIEGRMWLDNLIEKRLDGKRDGLRVRWDLDDGTYFYDPFTRKLTKATNG